MLALADRENVPLNVLVAAAATAVDASVRHTTETLLVHAVDNRFADPELNVATCLVNSIAQPVRFPPHASVAEVVRIMDRGYVKAGRAVGCVKSITAECIWRSIGPRPLRR
ncbi:cyclic synthetase [Mycolicibacterium conceptionense]|uniref:Cyclic synthetase n=1 Tax=Mycolicibacterium conceptionense TaxID=451644 RepID=A0A0U1DX65_9MYCO|nr:cyclic synthetase [Mycolicibacterium conceptionense]